MISHVNEEKTNPEQEGPGVLHLSVMAVVVVGAVLGYMRMKRNQRHQAPLGMAPQSGRYGKVSTTAPEEAAGWDEGWNDNESDDGWGSDNSGKGAAGTGWEEDGGEKADAADGWGLEDEEAPQPAKERRVPTTPLNVESGSEGSGDEWGKF